MNPFHWLMENLGMTPCMLLLIVGCVVAWVAWW
jgi:hypothetical protein